jgi:PKD repeat protein
MVQAPAANFSFQQIPHCFADSVGFYYNLDSLGKGVDSIYWQIGTSPTLTNTWVASKKPLTGLKKLYFASLGTYYVTMKVINLNKCESIVTKPFIMACIEASFTKTATIVCDSVPVTFTDKSTPAGFINTRDWDFGDGTPHASSPSVTHIYNGPGSYTVKLIVTSSPGNGSVSDTSFMPITVNPSPKAIFSVNTQGVCQHDSIEFTNNSMAGTYSDSTWNFMGVGHATNPLANPVVYYYEKAGNYKPIFVVKNSFGCSDTSTINVSVFKLPIAKIESIKACIDQMTQFIDGSEPGSDSITHWNWEITNSTGYWVTDTIRNFSVKFDELGDFDAKLSISDKNGCSSFSSSVPFTVSPSPVSDFSFVDEPDPFDEKWILTMTNKSQNAVAPYLWDFWGVGSSQKTDPVYKFDHRFDEEGDYPIKLISFTKYPDGCTDTITDTFHLVYKGLYIPNAFAPDSPIDTIHNLLPVGIGIKKFLFEVYDRWGNLVFQTEELDSKGRPTKGWNGKQGQSGDIIMPAGTYLWKASAVFKDGTVWTGNNIIKQKGKENGIEIEEHHGMKEPGSKLIFGTATLIR